MKNQVILFLMLLITTAAYSCTTFVLKTDSSLVFGRNLDWVSDNGVILVNKRNTQKISLVFSPEKATKWTSKYGSVSFNQFGKELPFGGINEKGLTVEIMVVSGNYPKFDNRTALNELQWVQYQLDNSETIEDVIASDSSIRISKINQSIHFLICDRFGNTAVIEFDKNGMNVFKDSNLPILVLENDPYAISLKRNEDKDICRFRTANSLIKEYDINTKTSIIDYSFNILDKVALDGSWSIIYDIKNMEIHFKTSSYQTLRKIRVSDFDFSCKQKSQIYDLQRKDKEFVNSYFINYSSALNSSKLDDAIKTNRIELPKNILEQFYNINSYYNCID